MPSGGLAPNGGLNYQLLLNDGTPFLLKTLDTHLSPIAIPDTAKPASPQITIQLSSSDIALLKSPIWCNVSQWGFALSVTIQKILAGNQGWNGILNYNGTDTGTTMNNPSETFTYICLDNIDQGNLISVKANDIMGVKLWSGNANAFQVVYAALFLFPTYLTITDPLIGFDGLDAVFTPLKASTQLGISQGSTFTISFLAQNKIGFGVDSTLIACKDDFFTNTAATSTRDNFTESNSPIIDDMNMRGFDRIKRFF